MKIAVINYGAGNLPNAVRALEYVGADLHVTSDPADVQHADAVVLPGVGATADTMRSLTELGLDAAIRTAIEQDMPFLGICVGMQILAEVSEEFGQHACLGIIPGVIRRLPATLKVPQIGWNQVQQTSHPLFDGIPPNSDFYFVHSYYLQTADSGLAVGTTEYGVVFPSAIARNNLVAVQFHPEKSGQWGLQLLRNWVQRAQSWS